jgi:PKD repeat protein
MSVALQPATAAAAWVDTASAAITLDKRVPTSAMPDATPINLSVTLKLNDRSAVDALIKNLYTPGNPQYGHYLTPAQFTAAYSPTAAQAQKVVDYLKNAGFSNVTLAANRLLISAQGTAAVTSKAFNTSLVQFQKDGRTVHVNTTTAQVPDMLGGVVLEVAGLDNIVHMKTTQQQAREKVLLPPLAAKVPQLQEVTSRQAASAKSKAAATAGPAVTMTAYPPTAWDIAYDAGTSPDGGGSTIAISTYGDNDSSVVDDLRQMERQYGLPYVPVEVRIDPAGIASPSSSGDDEWDLDSQSSTALAHNVKKIILYTGDGSTENLLWQYNTFATMGDAIAGNMSYGTCELDAATGVLLPPQSSADQLYMQAMAEGLSWHASTGDDGGVCSPINAVGAPLAGVPLLANYPDSSPYVVAVGGTSLITDADFNYSSESAWTSGGGGISVLEAAPTWQSGIVPSSTLTSIPGLGTATGTIAGGTGVGRGVPDIAMNAGIYLPESAIASAADTIVGGVHYAVVGTSLSSPLATGAWARLQSAHCNTLGFAAPAYYALDTAGGLMSTATGFNDVTTGTNGDYFATTGWDYTTGFGSIDLTAVNAALPAVASTCTQPQRPIAKLSVATPSGTSTVTTSYDGSGSSDPAGDTLSYYTVDFGDDTLPLQQTTPAFAAHTYTAPGIYTVSLTVVNSHGAVSLPATQTVTVAGVPVSCAVPGKLLASIPAGSGVIPVPVPIAGTLLPAVPDPLPSQDLLSASIAEPASMPGKLVFTIAVTSLSTLPPGTRWAVFFTLPGTDTTAYYVAMKTDAGTTTPNYVYGQRGSVGGVKISTLGLAALYNDLGSLDAASTYDATAGTITLVLDETSLGLKVGDTLQAFLASTSILVDLPTSVTGLAVPLGVGETVDSTATRFGYTLIGTDPCAGIALPIGGGTTGTTTGGSTGTTTAGGVTIGTGSSTESSRLGGAFGPASLLLLGLGGWWRRRLR